MVFDFIHFRHFTKNGYIYIYIYIYFFFLVRARNMAMGVITLIDKIICEDSNLKKRICLIYVLTVALFSCLGMICEFRHLKFFKLLLDRVNLLNQLYWYLWSYCKRTVLNIYVCFELCYVYY